VTMDRAPHVSPNFVDVTEVPGVGADREQLERAANRYAFAASYAHGKRVLEVACGAGPGLGLLHRQAASVVAGDLTPALLRAAHHHYATRVSLAQFDGQRLPFANDTFDVIVLFEALYYLPDAALFVAECRRVLGAGGTLIISTVNKEWPDFNPSPFSVGYHSARELAAMLESQEFTVNLFAAFPVSLDSPVKLAVSLVRRIAVRFHLIPRSMKAKQILRRLFMGALQPMPAELEPAAFPSPEPTPIESLAEPVAAHKIIYAVGIAP
jgi:SAM-dependent methyltransferase